MILLTAAFPFVPADLSIAHFASTYVPADISKRLLTAIGENALLVSATDYHSIYASQDGKTTDWALCKRYHQDYLTLFERMNIRFDRYFTTDAPSHKARVQETFRHLLDSGRIEYTPAVDQICADCGCFLPRRFSEEGGKKCCHFCGGKHIEEREMSHFFLKLSDTADDLRNFANALRQKDVKNTVLHYAASRLSNWNISRYNALGVSVPGDNRQSFYIWFDSLVGYSSLCAECVEAPRQVIHFIGKNIIYYHSVVWQSLSKLLFGPEIDVQISARGFLDLEETDASLLNLTTLTERCHRDLVRVYLAFKVKDDIRDYSFSEQDFRNVANYYCCKRVGGFFHRVWKLLQFQEAFQEDEPETDCREYEGFLRDIGALARECNVHEVLRLLLARVDALTNRFLSRGTHVRLTPSDRATLLYETAILVCLLSAYMPDLAKDYTVFEQWVPQTLNEAKHCCAHFLKKQKEVIRLNGLFS